jgi:predicted RND superfamily exporter protein/outer membrane lipoprotein-sorting protein
MRYPRTVMVIMVVFMLALASQLPRIKVDTDPENMLSADQPSRVFHHQVKEDFSLYDMVVVGIVNDKDADGVFNPQTLARIHQLTREIEKIDGVVRQDIMSLASVDNIKQGGPGEVRFEWMMSEPPKTREEARAIGESSMRLPMINGTIVSEDSKAAGIYVPIIDKNEGHRVASLIKEIVAEYDGDEQYYITGLPVAEATFGVEMFKQMGISAPLAMLIIFIMMLFFFRSISLILSPMILAMVSVISTMGLLIGMGYTVHIMSSMIPIFLMPIAVVDSVHILSEFADLYPKIKDKRETVREVMRHLFKPLAYTTLTTVAGFGSLAMAPIPPVRVFGIFVAFGVAIAFLLTITFIPAYIVRLSDARIDKIRKRGEKMHDNHALARILGFFGPRTLSRAKLIVVFTMIVLVISAVGISRIEINDNPVRWFRPSHEIRVSDRVLNHHFGGTYNAFLVLKKEDEAGTDALSAEITSLLKDSAVSASVDLLAQWNEIAVGAASEPADKQLNIIAEELMWKADEAATDEEAMVWEDVLALVEERQTAGKYFQNPAALRYIEELQTALLGTGLVGKSNSITDIVKTVHRELREGDATYYSIPGTSNAVAQTLLSYQSSHRPDDLFHFITPDAREANIWLQLKSGDNQDMAAVKEQVDNYIASHPLPDGVILDWAGLTYLNVVWQQDMVAGMFNALMGSFVIVFIMMLILFRSFWFGLLAMLPLSLTITFIYGLIGLIGKDYDMPVAVLSSLALGLSVDFAIHFMFRAREVHLETRDMRSTIKQMFEEPARAIARNAIVIAIGFLPLLASPLVPYNTVGIFLSLIMAISCVVTLAVLPALLGIFRNGLFRKYKIDEDAGNTRDSDDVKPGGNKMKKAVPVIALAAVVLGLGGLGGGTASAEDLTDVNTIIERANNVAYYAGEDGRARVRMTISDSQGRERIRQFTILRKDRAEGGDQYYAVLFSRPADVRNTVFLVKKHVKGDDDRWLYLPGLDLVKRIAAGDKRTSFVGSHFYYEDVSGRAIDEDTHELVETTGQHYIIKNVPKDKGGVEFATWTATIDKKTLLPVKMEYYDESGELYRTIEALEVGEFQGHPTVTKMKVSDLRSGGSTVSEFRNVQYDLGIPDDVFTERTLRSPSREWFRGKK